MAGYWRKLVRWSMELMVFMSGGFNSHIQLIRVLLIHFQDPQGNQDPDYYQDNLPYGVLEVLPCFTYRKEILPDFLKNLIIPGYGLF
jgi:hypothetical protein